MYEQAIAFVAIGHLVVTAIWIWTVFFDGAEYIGPRSFVIPWSPRAAKVFVTVWLLLMTYLLLAVILQIWPVGGLE